MKNFKLVKNKKFGFLQVSPTPSKDEITKFYADEFYSGEYKNFNDSSLEVQTQDKEFFEGRWEDMYLNFEKILGKKIKEANVLDVGCGWGLALLYLKNKGLNCYGFDPAPEAVEYGNKKGLNLKHAGLDGIDVFNGKKFDIIMLNNVLEHLEDPEKILTQVRSLLTDDGVLSIDVPNEFNDFQVGGKEIHNLNEWWLCPPNHLNYFTVDSLLNLLDGINFKVNHYESSFPLEMFLLFGDNYVKNGKLGKECHKKRVAFENNLRKVGKTDVLRNFYHSLAKLNLGRQIIVYATKK